MMLSVNDKSTIFDKLHQLPAMPLVVQELMGSFRNANAGSATLARQIALDQGLSAKVLRVANSSFYGLPREIGSIQDAVTVLGFDSVRSLVLSAGFMRAFPAGAKGPFDYEAYWVRSFRVATYTEALSQCMGGARQLAFTAGMFHDVGQLILNVCIPEKFAAILEQEKATGLQLVELEKNVLGFDHAEIGAEMARRWNFPAQIEHAIHYWRDPAHEPLEAVTSQVFVAALLESGLRGADLMEQLPERLCQRLSINWQRIEPCLPHPEQLDAVANLMLDV
jgi:putative nucleotidyltransferase with HDIG domain